MRNGRAARALGKARVPGAARARCGERRLDRRGVPWRRLRTARPWHLLAMRCTEDMKRLPPPSVAHWRRPAQRSALLELLRQPGHECRSASASASRTRNYNDISDDDESDDGQLSRGSLAGAAHLVS